MNMRRQIHTIQRERATQWVRPLAVNLSTQTVQIIGGNLQNGVGTIKYVATGGLAATALYDPNVDTVYDDGLGYGDLYTQGSLGSVRVLVRNDYAGFADTILGGDVWLVSGFGTETVASGPDAGAVMRVALIRRG